MYICPVCGYNGLETPPENFTVCPSCYTEFGYDDATLSAEALRREWIQNGMRWAAADVLPPPPDWNPVRQLIEAGITYRIVLPRAELKVATVDLGPGATKITFNGSFTANLRGRIVAIGHSMPDLPFRICSATVSNVQV